MNNHTEPHMRTVVSKMLKMISVLIIWAMITIFFGLNLEWALILGSFNGFNWAFYSWFVVSFSGVLYYFYRIWFK